MRNTRSEKTKVRESVAGKNPKRARCEDCENRFGVENMRRYKYERSVLLCDGCHDSRMEEYSERLNS